MAERQVSRDEDPEEKAREDQRKRATQEAQFQGVRKEKAAVRHYLPWVIGGLLLLALITIAATSGLRKENTTLVNPGAAPTSAQSTGAASAQGAPGSMGASPVAGGGTANGGSTGASPGGGVSPGAEVSPSMSQPGLSGPGNPVMGSPAMGSPAMGNPSTGTSAGAGAGG